MWEEKAYEIGERSYDDMAIQANQAVSQAGLYAGIGVGAVALGSAYYVNAKSPLYNPDIAKKKSKPSKREQAVQEVLEHKSLPAPAPVLALPPPVEQAREEAAASVGSRMDRRANKDNMLKKALNKIKSIKL